MEQNEHALGVLGFENLCVQLDAVISGDLRLSEILRKIPLFACFDLLLEWFKRDNERGGIHAGISLFGSAKRAEEELGDDGERQDQPDKEDRDQDVK